MLYDSDGNRKYLTPEERWAFVNAARCARPDVETFCLTLAYTGARISEVLAITPTRIDLSERAVVIESLKKRKRGTFRAIPVPRSLLDRIETVHAISAWQLDGKLRHQRIWPWCRTTAWTYVKSVMTSAGLHGAFAVPKGLRHGFGIATMIEANVPLSMVKKWLGHTRIETTAIYANAVGREERVLLARVWREDP